MNTTKPKNKMDRSVPNRLREAKVRSAWLILAEQFKSLMTVLLVGAGVPSFALGDWAKGLAIGAVMMINAAIECSAELRALRSMEAFYRLGRVTARVRRKGRTREILSGNTVPGDIVRLEGAMLSPLTSPSWRRRDPRLTSQR